jgi:MFS family permease
MSMQPLFLLRVFVPFALGYFLSYLYRTVNAVIAPDLVADLGLDPADLGLLTASYFLAFALFQLPLGVLLDRYGPRRVEALLLLFAAAGALLFASAETLQGVLVGRALIGLGVSACLMAAFKAFAQSFPPERLPLANGVQMVSGGLGALAATAPVEAALQFADWRGVFLVLGLFTILTAATIWLAVPEHPSEHQGERLSTQLQGIGTIFRSPSFLRIAPWAVAGQAAFLSIQGLWAGPWLHDVGGYGRSEAAQLLLLIAAAMTLGYLVLGALAERLARRGIPPLTVAVIGMSLFMVVQLLLTLQILPQSVYLWILFGFTGTACILPYAVLSQIFPRTLSGRANTGLNLLVFLGAFACQWGIGAVIGIWPKTSAGDYHPDGYRAGFAVVLALQLLAAAWFVWMGRKRQNSQIP